MKTLIEYINENWSEDVKTKWSPKKGIFTEDDPQKIYNYLMKNSNNKGQAMKRLVFYMNRAGSNLENRSTLEKVKNMLKSK